MGQQPFQETYGSTACPWSLHKVASHKYIQYCYRHANMRQCLHTVHETTTEGGRFYAAPYSDAARTSGLGVVLTFYTVVHFLQL